MVGCTLPQALPSADGRTGHVAVDALRDVTRRRDISHTTLRLDRIILYADNGKSFHKVLMEEPRV
jgi:hypothetical protein